MRYLVFGVPIYIFLRVKASLALCPNLPGFLAALLSLSTGIFCPCGIPNCSCRAPGLSIAFCIQRFFRVAIHNHLLYQFGSPTQIRTEKSLFLKQEHMPYSAMGPIISYQIIYHGPSSSKRIQVKFSSSRRVSSEKRLCFNIILR